MTVDDEAIKEKWKAFAVSIERLAERVGEPHDLAVKPGSSLDGDDRASHPFELSQAIRHIINATVDQLHGAKVAVDDSRNRHLAVSATLSRTAIENVASGVWMLGPRSRNTRVERVLRWHARNYQDFASFLRASKRDVADILTRNTQALSMVEQVAESRRIDVKSVASGLKVTTPIKEAAD
jgi:hypothetical protein